MHYKNTKNKKHKKLLNKFVAKWLTIRIVLYYKYHPYKSQTRAYLNMHDQMAIHIKKEKKQRGGDYHLFPGIRHSCKQL